MYSSKLTLCVLLLGTGSSVAGMPQWGLLGRHRALALELADWLVALLRRAPGTWLHWILAGSPFCTRGNGSGTAGMPGLLR